MSARPKPAPSVRPSYRRARADSPCSLTLQECLGDFLPALSGAALGRSFDGGRGGEDRASQVPASAETSTQLIRPSAVESTEALCCIWSDPRTRMTLNSTRPSTLELRPFLSEMAATRSLPDLATSLTATENDLDSSIAPPSPTALPSPKWSSPTSSPPRSPSPPPILPPETPRTPHFYAAISSPLPPAFPSPSPPRYLDEHDDVASDFEDARDSYDDEREGGPGTFTLHHPGRARSDYSIHSAPELETNHMMEESFVEEQPASPSPSSPRTTQRHLEGLQRLPYTLWDYLQEEVSHRTDRQDAPS